ncbi:unnamed protein product, partial [Linum tenue]
KILASPAGLSPWFNLQKQWSLSFGLPATSALHLYLSQPAEENFAHMRCTAVLPCLQVKLAIATGKVNTSFKSK